MKQEEESKRSFISRIQLSHLYFAYVVLLAVISIILIAGARQSEHSIVYMQEITEEYAAGQDAINELMDASDYLTEQSRVFVVTGDPESGHLYQEEIEINRRRDRSLATIRDFHIDEHVITSVEKALDASNELAKTEYYAMLLAASGHGLEKDVYESFTGGAVLSEKDRKLSGADKVKKATRLVFDENYNDMKSEIRTDVADSLEQLLDKLKERQIESYEQANELFKREHILFVIVLAATFIMAILTAVMVIMPLRKSTEKIMRNEPLSTHGSSEFYCLAEAYNGMLAATRKHQEKLSYEATHDELTGLHNRKLFEQKKDELTDEDIAMLILDIDHFKEVNDTYGHETGDKVLKKVGSILSSSFRIEDYVCRIGGDEFAVIMRQMTPDLEYVVRDKINKVQEKLLPKDDLPKTTLSIGAAFSSDCGPEDNLFKLADKTLYSVKAGGRDGYAFYSELQETGYDR
ncbi:MAG: GGDEF domain-containing protein [Eubacterium sp.]|nr:GGDEF domain-containing protein [Eubacterium sp.]